MAKVMICVTMHVTGCRVLRAKLVGVVWLRMMAFYFG